MSKYPIIVRMDDICPQMNIDRFLKYKNMFDSLGIKPLIGVIPDCKDTSFKYPYNPAFWEMVKSLIDNGWSVSMHGYNHVYTTTEKGLICQRPMSEFAGVPYNKQLDMLKKGKAIFIRNGIDVDTFMAPGHSYDKNTIKAMRNADFQYLTDGRSLMPYMLDGIKCIPASSAFRLHLCGLLTICVHCETETNRDFEYISAFLLKNRERIISFDEAKKLSTTPYYISRLEERVSLFFYYKVVPIIVKLLRR